MAPDGTVPALPTETLPCGGLRVVDATDAFGAYAGRLLADLGAEVVRVIPRTGDPLEGVAPFMSATSADGHDSVDQRQRSAFAWFVNLNKHGVEIDAEDPVDRQALATLLAQADVLLESWTPEELLRPALADLVAGLPPTVVRVSITAYGSTGPWSERPASDLTALASGGLLALGGYPDAEPVAAHGGQSQVAASIFGAVAALLGVLSRQRDGRGRHLDVSAQEAIAAALEDAIPQFDLTGRVRKRTGGDPREAGTGVLACKDGYVSMVAGRLGTAKAWTALTAWLVEEGVDGADELAGEAWTSFPFRQRPESVARFQEIFERFAATRTKDQLYLEAQRRSIALAPVNTVGDVLGDPQLDARDFFRIVHDPAAEHPIVVPGRPYRLGGDSGPTPRPMVMDGAPSLEHVEPSRTAVGAEALDRGAA